jgi:hypothetical protein
MITLAVRSVLRPRIGHNRALSRPWSHSTRLFAYCSVLCTASGNNSAITYDNAAARSVTTSSGRPCASTAAAKDRPGGRDITASRNERVDDLAVLIDRPVHVAPRAGGFEVGLIDEPARPDRVPIRSRSVYEQRSEPLHLPNQGDVIDVDAAFREEFLEIAVRQPEPEIPPDRQHDHLGRETETRERRSC